MKLSVACAIALTLSLCAFAGATTTPSTSTASAVADPNILLQQTLAISLGGQEVGTVEALDKKTKDGAELSRVTKLTVQRGAVTNKMTTVTLVKVDAKGAPVSYRYERTDAAGTLVTEGKIKNNVLELATTQNGATVRTSKPVPAATTFALALEHEMRGKLADGVTFDRDVVIEEMGASVKMAGSVKKKGDGFMMTSTFMNLTTEEEVDARGRTVVARTPSMGIVAYPIGRAPPDVGKGSADLLAISTWTTKPVTPPVSRVLYKVSAPDAKTFAVPEDARQKVQNRTNTAVTIEVKTGDTFAGKLSDERKAELTAATPYEATQDPRIVKAANAAAQGAADKLAEVKQLNDFVFKHVEAKGLDRGYAPAVATLESKAGDCTEHSVLLSALLRARGFPTRLVDGVIVDGTKAGYHEWVEVYIDGRGFVPADPTFGAFPAGPERLKLAEGSTSPDEHLVLSLAAARLLKAGVKVEVLEVNK